VGLPEPIRDFFYAYESLGAEPRRTWWGLVVADRRFPHVFDANKACVLEPSPDLTLVEVEGDLEPLLDRNAIGFEHIEFMDLGRESPALDEARVKAGRVRPDVVMRHEGPPDRHGEEEAGRENAGRLVVREEPDPDAEVWRVYRDSRLEFGAGMSDRVLDELVHRDRILLIPSGQRLFVARVEGEVAGFASLISLARVGYVDNVVTLPAFRRRGVASATVTAVVAASAGAGDVATFLLAEEGGRPQALYERLGFRVVARAAGFTWTREGAAPGYL
jgi:ribosomal protein S18 acetylase RimI-like enzyme